MYVDATKRTNMNSPVLSKPHTVLHLVSILICHSPPSTNTLFEWNVLLSCWNRSFFFFRPLTCKVCSFLRTSWLLIGFFSLLLFGTKSRWQDRGFSWTFPTSILRHRRRLNSVYILFFWHVTCNTARFYTAAPSVGRVLHKKCMGWCYYLLVIDQGIIRYSNQHVQSLYVTTQ